MALRRQMEHAVEALILEDAVERTEMREVAVDEFQPGVDLVGNDVADVLLAPVGFAHQTEHLVPVANEEIGQMRPGKPGNARDQVLHAAMMFRLTLMRGGYAQFRRRSQVSRAGGLTLRHHEDGAASAFSICGLSTLSRFCGVIGPTSL